MTAPRSAAKDHPCWPKTETHPATGEPFVDGALTFETEVQELRFAPPMPPRRALFDVNEHTDELVYVRELTDKEMKAATKAYNKAAKEYAKTNGVMRVPGRAEIKGSLVTKSGAKADGIYDGDLWHGPGQCKVAPVNCDGDCCGHMLAVGSLVP